MIEYRVCWNASSNISFAGNSDWTEWEGEEETAAEVEDVIYKGEFEFHPINIPWALGAALEASGFDYWAEVREV